MSVLIIHLLFYVIEILWGWQGFENWPGWIKKEPESCFTVSWSHAKRHQHESVSIGGGKPWLSSGDISYFRGCPSTTGGGVYGFWATVSSNRTEVFPGYTPEAAMKEMMAPVSRGKLQSLSSHRRLYQLAWMHKIMTKQTIFSYKPEIVFCKQQHNPVCTQVFNLYLPGKQTSCWRLLALLL